MTPAQKAGLVVGQKYKVKADADYLMGKTLTFDRDDSSTYPYFRNEDDEMCCVCVDDIEFIVNTDTTDIKVTVENGSTTIVFGKALSANQIYDVLKAAE